MKIVEKLLWCFFVLIMVAAFSYGFLVGLPSTIPAIAMKSEKITEQKLRSALTDEQETELDEMLKPTAVTTSGAAPRGTFTIGSLSHQ